MFGWLWGRNDPPGTYGDEEKHRKAREKLNKYERQRRAAAKERAQQKKEREQRRKE